MVVAGTPAASPRVVCEPMRARVLEGAGRRLQRIDELLSTQPLVTEAAGASSFAGLSNEMRFERIVFGFAAKARTLDGLDLSVRAGERVAIVGPCVPANSR